MLLEWKFSLSSVIALGGTAGGVNHAIRSNASVICFEKMRQGVAHRRVGLSEPFACYFFRFLKRPHVSPSLVNDRMAYGHYGSHDDAVAP